LKEAVMFDHSRNREKALGLNALALAVSLAIFPLPGVLGTEAV
jgi:hypothetical protein